jgi:hypothetical protein
MDVVVVWQVVGQCRAGDLKGEAQVRELLLRPRIGECNSMA